jgi:hypothetical protein
MRKIDKLRIALSSGAFWRGFFCKPLDVEITPNPRESRAELQDLWVKYRNLVWKYDDNDLRLMALYDAHHRDLMRLLEKLDKTTH